MATDPNDPFGDLSLGDPVEPYKDYQSTPVDSTPVEGENNSGFEHIDPDMSPFYWKTHATTFGGRSDVVTGQDNGLFAGGGASVLDRRTGKPITESQVEDVRKNPQDYIDNPEYYASVRPWLIDKGIVKFGQQMKVTNPTTGKMINVTVRDKGPGNGPASRDNAVDLSPAALNDLYDGKSSGRDPVAVDFRQFFTSTPEDARPQIGEGDHQAHPDYLKGGEDYSSMTQGDKIRSIISQTPQRAMIAGDITDAALEDASEGAASTAMDSADVADSGEVPETTLAPKGAKSLIYPPIVSKAMVKQATIDPDNPNGVVYPDGTKFDGPTRTYTYKDPAGRTWMKQIGQAPFVSSMGGADLKQNMAKAASKKGVLRENYDTQEEYESAAKEILSGYEPGVVKDLSSGIKSGTIPPDLKGMYRFGAPVRAQLARDGYDLTKAQLEFQSAQRYFSSANSTPQLKLRQSIDTAYHSLDKVDELSSKWKGGKFPILNKANLVLAKNGTYGPEAQSIATQLDGQITDLTAEVAQVFMGGGTPTEEALKLAKYNLSSNWSEATLHDMTNLTRQNLQYRKNAIQSVGPVSPSSKAADATAAPANAPAPIVVTKVMHGKPGTKWEGHSFEIDANGKVIRQID